MTNEKCQMTKEYANDECLKPAVAERTRNANDIGSALNSFVLLVSNAKLILIIRASLFLGHSSFVIRHFPNHVR